MKFVYAGIRLTNKSIQPLYCGNWCTVSALFFATGYSLWLDKDDDVDDCIAHGENGPQDPNGPRVSQVIRLVMEVTEVG